MVFDLLLAVSGAGVALGMRSDRRRSVRAGTMGILSVALGLRMAAWLAFSSTGPLSMSQVYGDELKSGPAAATAQATVADKSAEDKAGSASASSAEASNAEASNAEASVAGGIDAEASPGTKDAANDEGTSTAEAPEEATAEAPEAPSVPRAISRASERQPVELVTNVRYLAANRPGWIESPPHYDGDTFQVAVMAGPYRTARECEVNMGREVTLVVNDFINQHLKAPHASTFISFSLDELRRRKVVADQFNEQLETSLGLMNQMHARLSFDNDFRDELDLRWNEVKAKSRLAQTGLGAGVVLLLLGTMFSYFRADTATKGYYTGRLKLATATAILALVAASVLLAKFIPWI